MGAEASSVWSEAARAPRRPRPLTLVLVVFAVAIMVTVVLLSAAKGLLAWDVRFAYLPAAENVLHGQSPYPALTDPILKDQKGYVYPPQLLLVLLPFAALPKGVVAAFVAIGLLALLLGTLRLLGVRDIRCYAAALLWVPSISGVLLGNVSIPIAFAAAVAWRYRDRVWSSAWALGLAIAAKFLLWPLLVWTAATRRLRSTAYAIAIGVVVTLAAWAVIGFDGLTGYPDLLRRLSDIQAHRSYSFVGMAHAVGLPESVGTMAQLVVGGALLAGCFLFARQGDEERSFTAAVVATLALSPIVWLHYLVLLLVPMAILRPRFSALWLLPVLLWISPKPGYAEGPATFAPALVVAVLAVALLRRGHAVSSTADVPLGQPAVKEVA